MDIAFCESSYLLDVRKAFLTLVHLDVLLITGGDIPMPLPLEGEC